MKRTLLSIHILLISFCGFSQHNTIDSLKGSLAEEKNDTTRISLFLKLAEAYQSTNLDTFGYYAAMAFNGSKKNNNYKLIHSLRAKGLSYYYNSEIDSARYCYDWALELLDEKDDHILRAKIYSNYALLYQESYDFQKKIDYNLKAIALIRENDFEVSLLYYNVAVLYAHAQMPEKKMDYLKKAYESSKRSEHNRVLGATLYGLSLSYSDDNKVDSAKIYLNEGLQLCSKTDSPDICFLMNNQQGLIYKQEKKFDQANKYLLIAKDYAERFNRKYDVMVSNVTLGQNEFERGNYNSAIKYFEEFDELYQKEPVPALGVSAYKDYARTEAARNNFRKSHELLNKYIVLKDSTLLKERRTILADVEAKYEAEKKDKELAEQQLQLNQQQSELQKKKTQYGLMTGIAIFLLVSSILIWFLYQQRQKRKNQEILTLKREQQVKTLESLMEGEEKERSRIARELHDGVNGDLSTIKYKLTSILEKNKAVVNEVVAMIDRSCEQVRAISHNLLPPSLERFSLIEALEDYCMTMNEIHEPEISFHHIGEPVKISKKNQANIYRTVQEMVSNSIKHAEASTITVQLSNRDDHMQITVEDNGKGFDKNQVQKGGIGLQNIQSRIDYLNASLDFVSNNSGTSYTIELNLKKLNDY
ncbi:sensor histidine kinase [Fulvivirgaceae bacterium BMA10]|uniref:histidine kinase n=1 Tax=Splendidivirga corallicola TaxID=3051826 RepID=A0ABT8KZX9_9BACT|nr:sensor histidine kinase [Fulvivirgaceae bacterium BMA10]